MVVHPPRPVIFLEEVHQFISFHRKILVSPLAYNEAHEYPKVQRIIPEFEILDETPVLVPAEIAGTLK